MLTKIQRSFTTDRAIYTLHARDEMRLEELGRIKEHEVFRTIQSGGIIESYPDDKPYPSVLIFGRTGQGRPIHIVCALPEHVNILIIVTVYIPDPEKWVNFERRVR